MKSSKQEKLMKAVEDGRKLGMKEKQLKKDVLNAIEKMNDKDLSLSNIIEYIDYINKVRYTEDEVIKGLIKLIKEHSS